MNFNELSNLSNKLFLKSKLLFDSKSYCQNRETYIINRF